MEETSSNELGATKTFYPPFLNGLGKERARTSLRLLYDAQAETIKNQIGDLESVRLKLNLSQRKMAQLLMVDPSAWTRWVKGGDKAPPHIWRALQWYLILQKEIPGLNQDYFLGHQVRNLEPSQRILKLENELQNASLKIKNLETENQHFAQLIEKNGLISKKIGFILIICFAILIFIFRFTK